MMQNHTIIGNSYIRLDAIEKVRGQAVYTDDLTMPGMVFAGCVHTKHPHAKVKVHIEKALQMDGVICILTASDFRKQQSFLDFYYCTDHPRFIGDVIAVVAAEDKRTLEAAIKAVEVEYEILPTVFSVEEAMKTDSCIIRGKGVGITKGIPDSEKKGNAFLQSHKPLRKGNIEQGFAQSDVIIERTYRTQLVEHAYIEPESVLVYQDKESGIMMIRSCSQQGHSPRDFAADALQIPLNKVRAAQCTIGGSFGGKFEIVGILCGRAAVVAKKTGRPCKMTLSREDSILESAKRHPFTTTIKIGADREGNIQAYQSTQIENCGAYNNQAPWMNIRAMVHSAGPYVIENIRTDTFGVFTNSPTPCAFRGYSSPQVIFGNEMIMDELAEALNMNVIALKKKNLLKKGSITATGQVLIHETILENMLDDILEKTSYMQKEASYQKQTGTWRKGIGLVTSYRGTALGGAGVDSSGAMFTALSDGSFILSAALMEIGQGLKTIYGQIAAEAAGLKLSDIQVESVDTTSIPESGLTVASRGTAQGGHAVRMAGEKMRSMLTESGRVLLKAEDSETVDIKESICYIVERPEEEMPVSEICTYRKYAGLPLATYEWYIPRELVNDEETGQGEAFTTYAYGVSVAEVLVNIHTGKVRVEKITAYHDIGKAINPSLIKGQIYGGILMGMGFGLWESIRMDQGRTKDLNFDRYHLATSADVPEMDIQLYECDDPEGVFGAKCIAEAATEMIGTTVALAVKHAIQRPVRALPVSMMDIVGLLGNDGQEEYNE